MPCVESLLDGQDRKLIGEVLIIDGGSRDATRSRITALAERHLEVRMLENPGRYAAHGMNVGLKEARGGFIVRADAHALYPPRYVEDLLRHHGDPRTANVGGVVVSVPGSMSIPARVISEAMGSVFGVGPSFRTIQDERVREVDTVPFGCWPRSLFDEVGFFDETFIRAQDLEFNQRSPASGVPDNLRTLRENRLQQPGNFRRPFQDDPADRILENRGQPKASEFELVSTACARAAGLHRADRFRGYRFRREPMVPVERRGSAVPPAGHFRECGPGDRVPER